MTTPRANDQAPSWPAARDRDSVACSICHPGFPPKPQYLADCHRLMERGWLDRKLIAGYVTFWLSEQSAKALELDGLQTVEPDQQN